MALPDVRAWHEAQTSAITADLGGDEQLTAVQRAAVRELARVEVILASLGDDLLGRGVLTAKGKSRAAALLYLKVLAQFERLVGRVGMERRARAVRPLAEVLSDE